MGTVVVLLFVLGIVGLAIYNTTFNPAAKSKAAARATRDAQLVCPHCQAKGRVTSAEVVRKKGISGSKATGALLTGGLSLGATGLSRKEHTTRMACSNCGTSWDV